MKKGFYCIFSTFILFTMFLFATCEIGLGSSVDTEAPVISVSRPSLDNVDVIRGEFPVMGTWSDDGEIQEIKINIKSGDDKDFEYFADVKKEAHKAGEGTWFVAINPQDENNPISDGSYSLQIDIKDKSGHVTSKSTNIIIDNTPPIVVLTRPSTAYNATSFDTYGQTFSLEGQAADTNNISVIEVNIYSDQECTNLVGQIALPNVPNSISMDAAVYDVEKEVYINPDNASFKLEVPNDGESEGEEFFCRIIAYDGAISYPLDGSEPDEQSSKGNAADYYYLYKDIATLVLQNHKITDVYSMLNGSYKDSDAARSASVSEAIINILEDKKVSIGKFALNPRNNPTFSVTGRNPLVMDGNDFIGKTGDVNTVSPGTQLTIEVSPGLDGYLLDEESLKVYAILCDDKGKALDGAEKIYPETSVKTSGTSYRFFAKISLEQGFKIGKNYVIGVEGYDQASPKGNSVVAQGKGYGFHMGTSGRAPELTITSPGDSNTYLKKESGQSFAGSVTVEAGEPVVKIYKNKVLEKTIEFTDKDGISSNNQITYNFKYDVSDFGETSNQYTYKILADQDGLSSYSERTIIYDADAPIIKITEPSYVKSGTTKYLNGQVTFNVSITDAGGSNLNTEGASPTYEILSGGKVIKTATLTNFVNENITINTRDSLYDGKTLVFRVKAQDVAGNQSVSTDANYTYTVDQNTDIPAIRSNSASLDFGNSESAASLLSLDQANTNATTKKNRLIRSSSMVVLVSDDEAIKRLVITRENGYKSDGSKDSSITSTTNTQEFKDVVSSVTYSLPNELGVYLITITAEDENFESKEKTPYNYKTIKFFIRVTGTGPDVKITPDKEYLSTRSGAANYKLTFNIDGAEANEKFYLSINDQPVRDSNGNKIEYGPNFVYEGISFAQGISSSGNIKFTVADVNESSTDKNFTPKFDNEIPEVTISAYPLSPLSTESDNYLFKGVFSDEGSGVKKVQIRFTDTVDSTKTSGWIDATLSSITWLYDAVWNNDEIKNAFTNENTKKLEVKAIDEAGNESQILEKSFVYDKKAPVIKSVSASATAKNDDETLTITLEDTNPVTPVIQILQERAGQTASVDVTGSITATAPVSLSAADNTWTSSVRLPFSAESGAFSQDGKFTIRITAKDENGRASAVSEKLIIRDSTAPDINITKPEAGQSGFIKQPSYKFEGNVVDENPKTLTAKLMKRTPTDDDPDKVEIIKTEALSLNEDKTWAWNVYELEVANYYLQISAEDVAGNLQEATSNEIKIDMTAPVLSITGTGISDKNGDSITNLASNTPYFTKGEFIVKVAIDELNYEFDDNDEDASVIVTEANNLMSNTSVAEVTGEKAFTITNTHTSASDDGTYEYTITVKDMAGNSETKTIKVERDSTGPRIEFKNPAEDNQTLEGTARGTEGEFSYTFKINASDDGVGVAKICYAFNQSENAPEDAASWTEMQTSDGDKTFDKILVSGVNPVSGKLNEGKWYLHVKSKDKAENESSVVTRPFYVDVSKPEISNVAITLLTGNGNDQSGVYYTNGNFKITGKAWDSNSLNKVIISQSGGNSADTTYDVSVAGAANAHDLASAAAWTQTFVYGSTVGKDTDGNIKLPDGSYTLKLYSVDAVTRKSSEVTKQVVMDTTLPVIEISQTADIYQNSNAYTFRGSITELNLKELKIQLMKEGESEAVQEETIYPANNNWSWTVTNLVDGQYYVKLRAEDYAGNAKSETGNKKVIVDTVAPVISLLSDGKLYDMNSNLVSENDSLVNKAEYFANDAITLKGSITENNFKDAAIKRAGSSVNFTSGGNASGSWTYNQAKADGKYDYEITVNDKAGNSSSYKITVTIDTTPPVINTITAPVSGATNKSAISAETFIFKGTAKDTETATGTSAGTGVSKILYAFASPSTEPADSAYSEMAASDGEWTIVKTINEGTSPSASGNLYEGKWCLYVKAQDKAGNTTSSVEKRVFDVDMKNPESTITHLTELVYNGSKLTETAANGEKYGKITLTGNASDTHGLETVKVIATPTSSNLNATSDKKEISLAVTDGKIGSNGSGQWTQEVVFGPGADSSAPNYLAEGKYDITVEAVDKATKKTSSEKLSITVDYTAPSITESSIKINDAAYDANKWYEARTLKLDVEASDTVSGGVSVSVITKKSDNSDRTSPLSNDNGNNYTGTAQFAADDDNLHFWLVAKDSAGNETAERLEKTVKIDTSAPSLELYKYKIGNGELKTASGTVYINGTDTLTVYGSYYDEESGVQNLTFTGTKSNTRPTITYSKKTVEASEDTASKSDYAAVNFSTATDTNEIKAWKAVFTNASLQTARLSVEGKNNAGDGLSTSRNLFEIGRDTQAPSLSAIVIQTNSETNSVYESLTAVNTYYVNNKNQKFTISGLAEDTAASGEAASGVSQVALYINGVDLSPNSHPSSAYFNNIDLSNYSNSVTVQLKATDNAGNTFTYPSESASITIIFDTTGPKGVHLMDDSQGGGKDLYFRIGDQSRDEFVEMNAIDEVVLNETTGNGTALRNGTSGTGNDEVTLSGVPEWDAEKDKDVGGKYSGNTFGKEDTVKLRGRFDDGANGSGTKLIYYKLYKTQPDSSATKAFLDSYESLADGYFSLRKNEETRRVFYTDNAGTVTGDEGNGTLQTLVNDSLKSTFTPVNGGKVTKTVKVPSESDPNTYVPKTITRYYTDITTNYKTTIDNLTVGENYLVFVAVDNVGNAALEGVEYNGVKYDNYRINVDNELPSISAAVQAIGEFTNANGPLNISGSVSDNPVGNNAGIKSVWLKYDEDINHWIKANVQDNSWTAVIPQNVLEGLSVSNSSVSKQFTATATDYSGKGNSFSCNFTVTIDKEIPKVDITTTNKPEAGVDANNIPYVNGSIKLKGSASDLNGLAVDSAGNAKKLSLWYRAKTASDTSTPTSVSSTSGWTKWETDVDNNTEWTIDTTGTDNKFLSANESSKIYYFTVEAKDRAGNSGYSKPLALNIDKDSDRPTAKFYLSFEDKAIMSLDKSELDGVISDDDGAPEKEKVWYYISYDSKAPTTGALVSGDVEPGESEWIDYNTWKAYDNNTAIFKYNESTGSFTFRPNDGTAYIWLKIQDKGGNTFITSNSTTYALDSIKISDQTGARILGKKPESGTTVDSKNVPRLKLKKDTIAPLTDSFAYLAKGMDETKEASANQGNGWSSSTGSAAFGGTSANTFRVRIYAYDVNGIATDGVQFKIPVESSDIKASSVPAPTQDPDDSTKSYYVYTLSKQNSSKLINNNSYDLYWSGDIDVTGFVSGQRSCIIDTFDGTKHKSESISFNIDNEPPEATVTSHNAGDQIRAAFNLKGGFKNGDAGTSLKYILLTSETAPDKTADDWTSRENVKAVTSMSWQVNFDGLDNSSSQENTHDGLPKKIIADLLSDVEIASSGTNEGKAVYKTADTNPTHAAGDLYKTITTVYFHMLASDAIGNSKVSTFSLKLDPQGDIPTIKMDYPAYDSDSVVTTETETTKAGLKYAKLSGNIRAQGSAEDDKNIVGIYMQIDPSFNMKTGQFASNWESKDCPGKTTGAGAKTKLSDFGYTIEDMYTSYNAQRGDKPAKTNGPRGIRVGSSSSWNITLNSSSEFNSDSGAYIAIRFYAVDEDGNISIWDDDDLMIIYIDSDAPKIGSSVPLYLYQYGFKEKSTGTIYYAKGTSDSDVTPKNNKLYTDADCKTEATGKTYSTSTFDRVVLSSMEYKKNMWLKGEWWLSGSIEDESGINDIKMKGTSIKSDCGSEETWNSGKPEETKGYIFNYKIGSTETETGYGTLTYALWAEDGQAEGSRKPANLEIAVQYDNKAPTLASTGDADYSIPTSVVNEQGFYKVQSSVTERDGESGFDKVFFYFKRGSTVYDAYMPKNVTGNKLTGLTEVSNIYWKTNTVTAVSANVITVSADVNIHKGGLVKVGGTIYTITGVSGTSVTLSGNPSALAANETMPAYFAIGHVVDHIGTEGESGTKEKNKLYGYGYYKNNTEDDGDLMLEKVSTGSTKTLWYGLINSRNIPDGAIEIHYVAFDKAGNMAHASVTNAKVENNGPRLASLRVWTDYNGNNSEDGGESDIKYYNRKDRKISGKTESRSNAVTQNLIVTGNDLGIEAGASAFMRVTDKTRFYPEIVGGNGALYYSYKIGAGSTSGDSYTVSWGTTGNGGETAFAAANRDGYVEYSDVSADYMQEDENHESYVQGSSSDEIEVGTSLLQTVQNGLKWFEYTIWDSTEGGTKYTDTLNAKFTVLLNVAYTDETKPTADITPFHWTSKDDNSIAWDGSGSEKKALGHIELEGDLTETIKNVTVNTTKMGDDPKVSGQIIFEGTASDDIRLKEIHAQFTDHKGLVADTLIGTYTPSTGEWTGKSGDGWSSTVENVSFGADGHTAHWKVTVDTAVVGTGKAVAALDRAFTVYAIAERGDDSHNKSDASTTLTGKSLVTTTWSAVKAESCASSRYYTDEALTTLVTADIKDTDTVYCNKTPYYKVDVVPYITGISTRLDDAYSAVTSVFNRSANGSYPVMRGETGFKLYGFNLNGASTTVKFNNTSVGTVTAGTTSDYVTFTVPNTSKSGNIDITVNSVASLNNSNSTTAEYNLEPNGINNDILNDNRSVYVWGMNDVLTGVSTVRYPSFRIGKDANQTIGFVYDRDGRTVYYNRGGTNSLLDTSYSQWYSTACAVGTDGHIYASAQNGDSLSNNYANYKFYAFANRANASNAYNDTGGAYTDRTEKDWRGRELGGTSLLLEWDYDNGAFYAERIKNPKVSTLVGTNSTNLYTVYFDSAYNRIVFRYGTASYGNSDVTYGNYGIVARGNNNSAANAQVIDSTDDVGQYAAVGVVPNVTIGNQTRNVAVVCWNSGNALKFKYNTTPANTTTWSDEIVIDADYAGEYCDLAVDAAGGIHIAYYRAGNKLKYAYLESYTDTTPDVCMVDSYLSVGENISIETSSNTISYKEGNVTKTRYVPYISYYSSAIGMAKVAWPVKLGTNGETANTFVNGANNDKFTGNWEVQVLPTALATKLLNYTIGVGEKKNGNKDANNKDIQSVMLGYGTKTGLQTALLY